MQRRYAVQEARKILAKMAAARSMERAPRYGARHLDWRRKLGIVIFFFSSFFLLKILKICRKRMECWKLIGFGELYWVRGG